MASEKMDEAREAGFEAIKLAFQKSNDVSGSTRGQIVRDAAIAWRALAGGTQPGSVVVEKG